jgi:hypothetical protein
MSTYERQQVVNYLRADLDADPQGSTESVLNDIIGRLADAIEQGKHIKGPAPYLPLGDPSIRGSQVADVSVVLNGHSSLVTCSQHGVLHRGDGGWAIQDRAMNVAVVHRDRHRKS